MALGPGRPRLDSRDGFMKAFCRILPRVERDEITPSKAASQLGISVRSFKRYSEKISSGTIRSDQTPPSHS